MIVAIVIVTCVLIASALLTVAAASTVSFTGDVAKWLHTLRWWARSTGLLAFTLLVLLVIGWATHTN